MRKENETKLIDFQGGQLLGVKTEDGRVWLGVKKACMDIGLTEKQADRQIANIQEDLVLKSKSLKFEVVQTEGTRQVKREVLGISEDVVTLWLAKISLTPKMQKENSQVVTRLVNYQLKCAKILHEAFMDTEGKKQEFYNELGLKGEIVELKDEVTKLKDNVSILIDSATINSYQAKQLLKESRTRMNELLGNSHSENYKKKSRLYFKNLWNSFAENFEISEYRDLNPMDYQSGLEFIQNWEYRTVA